LISAESKQLIESFCADVDKQVVGDFFARMDVDYFATFSPEEVSTHIRMASRLDSKHRVHVRVTPRGPAISGEFDIVIVGFDYLSEFSIFCGVISAFGLDIRSGDIYSFSKHGASRKIVDAFHVGVKPGEIFDEDRQHEFEEELQTLSIVLYCVV
jgi:UTP:GlnB (protein PII) uridylyltransferase